MRWRFLRTARSSAQPSPPSKDSLRIDIIRPIPLRLSSEEPCEHVEGPRTSLAVFDMLPDDMLQSIFHFCRVNNTGTFGITWEWETLVRVCRRWRHLIFASPRGLNLQLVCTRRTPVREMLDIWPAIPIIIIDSNKQTSGVPITNVIAALEYHDRIYGIWLDNLTNSQWQLFTAVTQRQFSALTFLELGPCIEAEQILPIEFLDGSSPNLHIVQLSGIPFPALPHLLLSSKDLVDLQLRDIPIDGYVSPMAMVASLSALANLQNLYIGFRSPKSPSDRTIRFPRPRKHVILPTLTNFGFRGVSEYLEDFVARIHTPSLLHCEITFFNQLIFDLPQLARFINRTERLRSFDQAFVLATVNDIRLSLFPERREVSLVLAISCNAIDWQLSSLAQVCSHLRPFVSNVEWLDLAERGALQPSWQDDMDDIQWLELFQTFPAVITLSLSKKVGPLALRALQGLSADDATEVLPALHELLLGDDEQFSSLREAIQPFLSARRERSNHTILVRRWIR